VGHADIEGGDRKTGICVCGCANWRRGKDLIVPAFRKHSGQMKRVFSELSPEELRGFEAAFKKVGKRAAALTAQRE
jgi:hypothetical protein